MLRNFTCPETGAVLEKLIGGNALLLKRIFGYGSNEEIDVLFIVSFSVHLLHVYIGSSKILRPETYIYTVKRFLFVYVHLLRG